MTTTWSPEVAVSLHSFFETPVSALFLKRASCFKAQKIENRTLIFCGALFPYFLCRFDALCFTLMAPQSALFFLFHIFEAVWC